ncbi:hypothetical protein MANES_02G183001v8 [Manihot esculenta]|uniref:Uncharacterized protein n=1 Tax=Manihot esculenta TaxID=3983 RepID=A0ACB7I909_MANES|nr:hypothetical protein MANES_02G183001v8 [Manihot esculenta]
MAEWVGWVGIRRLLGLRSGFSILFIFLRSSSSSSSLLLLLLWEIWFQCNERVWNNKNCVAQLVVRRSLPKVQEWRSVQVVERQSATGLVFAARWSSLYAGNVKLNVDAA